MDVVCADAAFACGWGTELDTDPHSAKSRTGHLLEVTNCPILWVSKLQPTTATNLTVSEHTALSMALHAASPL